MSSWGKWILAAGVASFGVHTFAKTNSQIVKKQSKQVIMRVNTRTNLIEVKTPRGWMATRQVTSENEQTQDVVTEPTGYWGYRGWIGGGLGAGWGGGYYNGYYPNYGYDSNYGYNGYGGYSGYGGYNSPDGTYYIAPYYDGYYYSGISTSYWNSYPSSYYFYTPTWTLYYGRVAYDPVNWFTSGLYNYYYYNL